MSVRLNAAIAIVLAAAITVLASAHPAPQDAAPLTNFDIIKLIAAKFGDSVILSAIETAPRTSFDLSVDGLIALKQSGASDPVIIAMQKAAASRPASRPGAPPAAPPAAPATAPAPVRPAAPPPARPAAVAPRQPTDAYVFYRVNAADGELIPLEKSDTKLPLFGPKMVWLAGSESSVRFTYGEPLRFAVLLGETLEKVRNEKAKILRYQIEPLAVKNDRRYASRAANVFFSVEVYGDPKTMMGRKDPYTAYSFLFTPLSTVPPGQYALTRGGMMDGATLGAFAIVQ